MSWDPDEEDPTTYKVVVNTQKKYTLVPAVQATPRGWREVGRLGSRNECLAFLDRRGAIPVSEPIE